MTSPECEVDLYALEGDRAFLFCHLKDARLAKDDGFVRKLADQVPGGGVVAIGRALKVENRSEPLAPLWLEEAPLDGALWAVEGTLFLRLETTAVLNPGLFLDQRENRAALVERVRIALESGPAPVLNLFSFTGSFSLAARSGGTQKTTSVDVSPRYLAWEKKSYERNFSGEEAPRLLKGDARDFLRRAKNRGDKFRFVVLDPPTFSRADRKVFRAAEHLPALVEDAIACLDEAPGSAVFVSSNDAGWDESAFLDGFGELARRSSLALERGSVPADFGPTHALRCAWLVRR
ncbi:MAG TPA: class I SAM-dependent methyltransferase [Polyangiaceae bacterium]|nr:class I SAM-dependent methyltransferase [Polyangiaceae bacterium]